MHIGKVVKWMIWLGAGALAVAATLLTDSRGRGACPQCGYSHDLYACKHCGWTACLGCWQRLSQYNTCPGCGRANP
ncbi:hypothetical protein [Candidatus Amarolinea aalborgensis]|uniref:hypothetical protein n=1 Tax=Candidatus Amarolinea aalborgensis TaxID=2249329 RepID=UPI003BF9F684